MQAQSVNPKHSGTLRSALGVLRDALPGTLHTLKPDQAIALEGGECDHGHAALLASAPDGRRHIMRFVEPGGLVGLGKLNAFRFTTEAVATSVVMTLSSGALDLAIATRADVRDAVLEALTSEPTVRDRIQFRLSRLWSDERVADFLLERATVGEGAVRMADAHHFTIVRSHALAALAQGDGDYFLHARSGMSETAT